MTDTWTTTRCPPVLSVGVRKLSRACYLFSHLLLLRKPDSNKKGQAKARILPLHLKPRKDRKQKQEETESLADQKWLGFWKSESSITFFPKPTIIILSLLYNGDAISERRWWWRRGCNGGSGELSRFFAVEQLLARLFA